MIKKGSLSVAKAILAILWRKGRVDTRLILNHPYLSELCSNHSQNTYRSSIHRLYGGGFIKRGNGIYTLTDKGRIKALTAFIDIETEIYKPDSKWDGGWRMLFFDVPESERRYRDYLRKIIKRIGFKEFQKSIWVYPYPVPSFLKDVFKSSEINKYARFITTESIENDKDLRVLFNLSRYSKTA